MVWNNTTPIDHTKIGSLPSEIRSVELNTQTVIEKEHENLGTGNTGGEHSPGAGVAYTGVTSAAPTFRPDGTTLLSANEVDSGRIWYDTTFTPPVPYKWDGSAWVALNLLAVNIVSAQMATQNTNSSSNGAREGAGQWRHKASISGSSKTLGYVEIAHDGTSLDEKGLFRVVLNDGNDADAPSITAIQLASDGSIASASSAILLDDDTMSGDDATRIATQQSIKAYVDAKTAPGLYGSTDSAGVALASTEIYQAPMHGAIYAYENMSSADYDLAVYISSAADPSANAGNIIQKIEAASASSFVAINAIVASASYFQILSQGGSPNMKWLPFGAAGSPDKQ